MSVKHIGDMKDMTRETIPKEHLMIGNMVGVNAIKYCVENGIEKGLTPLKPMTIIVDSKTVKYAEAMNIIVTNDTEIILVQE